MAVLLVLLVHLLALGPMCGRSLAAAPAREISLSISSEPAGADVWLGDVWLGITPLVRGIAVLPGDSSTRVFRILLDGYQDGELRLELDQPRVMGHAVLSVVPPRRPRKLSGSDVALGTPEDLIIADGVSFSATESAAALQWLNESQAETLRAAGVAPRQVNIILRERPFGDLAGFAATRWIGPKTLERVKGAVGE